MEGKDLNYDKTSEEHILSEISNTEQTKEHPRKTILFCVLGFTVLSLICWQVISSFMFNKNISIYATLADGIDNKLGILLNEDSFSLVQVIQGIKDIQKENKDLLSEANSLLNKNKFIIFKDTSVINTISKNDNKLDQLLAGSKELTSAIQRSEQMDKDIELMINNKTSTWKNFLSRCETLTKDNEIIKSDLVKAVVPEEIKKYQNILVEAMTEKGLFLTCFNDAMNSAFNAQTNLNLSQDYYYNAYFYWDLQKSYDYAVQGVLYANQADKQAQEGRTHWDKYKKLKDKIKADGESV